MRGKKGICIISLTLIICICLTACGLSTTTEPTNKSTLDDYNNQIVISTNKGTESSSDNKENESLKDTAETPIQEITSETETSGDIIVKFIDVGQADSCLIVTANNDAILIDAGEDKDAEAILDVLDDFELEDIDLMVLTHPHADHIGGAKTILENYKVEEVIMCSFVATSKLFENLIDTLESQEIEVTAAVIGDILSIDGVDIQIVGTDSKPKDNNNSSVVMKVTYGTVDILFTGDAEEPAEEIILQNDFDLNAEVLKVGHHGSETSTSDAFLSAVNPKVAIISVGEGNKYNHPSSITLNKLLNKGIQVYRTDEIGTITLEIDGENIVTSFEESFEVSNSRSANFLYSPNVAEIELNLNSIVDVSDADIGNNENTNQG